MKKLVKLVGIGMFLALALALLGVAPSFAQGPNGGPGPCHEAGLISVDQTEMHEAIADALGISVAEFNAARAEGKTLFVIAQELGVDMDVVREAMSAVREAAIDEALASGDLTEEQAEWLRSRPGMGGYGYGYGYGHRGGPQNGQGYGAQGQMQGQMRGRGYGPGNGAGWGR